MRESGYQTKITKRLEREFPGCVVIRNDPNYIQGIPDLLILYGSRWAMLEIKMSTTSPIRPNQRHYVESFGLMSYSAFIYPENEEKVVDDLRVFLVGVD